ncbi:hypothetical protein LPMP_204760 [Leishmania panamensis]|uniref:WW domain-containing protein n=1 Tax=Leishmania panamensis TaxID=5679 RepID=A0A088RRU9_LEIPA|nr:hypothetical protein LPMP_204760 [Leishmania panamensis]AIN97969.1 hypothetical protein LPMP_204760 [Leishmania panamensis]
MPRVPDKILVGPTTYVHFRRKHRDYYAPDFLIGGDDLPSAPSLENSEHVWRYSVSKEYNNTVFFFNTLSRKSVWVLPVVHLDGRTEPLGEGELMRTLYSSVVDGGTGSVQETTSNELSKASVHGEEKYWAARKKLNVDLTDSFRPSPQSASAVVDHSKSTRDNSPRDTLSATATSLAAAPSAGSSSPLKAVTGERTLEAEVGGASVLPSTVAEGEHHRPTLQDRIAAWRTRQRCSASQAEAQEQQISTTESPTVSTAATAKMHPLAIEDPFVYAMSSTVPTDKECGSSSAPGVLHTEKNDVLTGTPGGSYHHLPVYTQSLGAAVASPDPEGALHTPVSKQGQSLKSHTVAPPAKLTSPPIQGWELATATELLRREKIAAMRQEIAALECRRRALAVEQAEAEECARLAQARATAERARLQDAEQAAREQAQRRAAESRVQDVNEYLSKQRQLQEVAQSTVEDSFTYASRIAAQLAAAAPRPENILIPSKGNSSEAGSGASARLTPPHYRVHQVGRVVPAVVAPQAALPMAEEPDRHAAVKKDGESAVVGTLRDTLTGAPTSAGMTTTQRRQQRLAYAMPHLYEGEVITYRPSSNFTRQAALHDGTAAIRNQPPRTLNSSAGPTAPVILASKRDGTGTQYYDAAHQHFFTGTWREDNREGIGVLSLPTTAVQGSWQGDQLVGPAVLQTRHSKGTVTFISGKPAGGSQAPGTSPSRTSSRPNGALPSGASYTSNTTDGTTTLTGNAVVELDNKALFVGALKEGRVRAPYILQLGQGDYIEWIGASACHKGHARVPDGTSGELLKHTPAHLASSSSSVSALKVGTGECRIRFRNGDTYVGHVCNFQLHGFGYYRFAEDGHSYTGHFEGGWPHGKGLLIFANSDVYRGGFAKGLFNGHGTYASHAEQYVYEGDWIAGKMNGEGSLAFANGDVWKGTFKDDNRVAGAYTTLA